jgi:hypothetical protein
VRSVELAVAGKGKVVLTDYVWGSLDVKQKTPEGFPTLVALKTKAIQIAGSQSPKSNSLIFEVDLF